MNRYDFWYSLVISKQAEQEFWMRWAWTYHHQVFPAHHNLLIYFVCFSCGYLSEKKSERGRYLCTLYNLTLKMQTYGWIFSHLFMNYDWARLELWTRQVWTFLVFVVICEWARHKLWMRWVWTLSANNLSSYPTKNSSKKFIRKEGQGGNELWMTKSSD